MYSTVSGNIGHLLMKLFGLFPIKNNKIVFQSYYGEYFNDNPKYIYEAMHQMHPEYDYVWLMRDAETKIDGCRIVKCTSMRALYELATAKCWIDNARKREWYIKRKSQYYVQTWHGGIGIKAVEKAVIDKLSKKYVDSAIHDSKMADLFLAGSDWLEDNYIKYFWYDGKILKKGLPREDWLYNPPSGIHEKVCSFYNVGADTHFVLYAPTFRNGGDIGAYNLDYKKVIDLLKSKTGFDWKLILRLHPNVRDKTQMLVGDQDILDGSQYDDINDLMISSDYLISDYSSCMYDAMIAGKIVFIYASDIDEYADERGCWFKIRELPFDIATNTIEMLNLLENFNLEEYKDKVDKFKKPLGMIEGGNASNEVARYIFDEINLT